MQEDQTFLDIAIDTGDLASDTAVDQLLTTSAVDELVAQTLQTVGVQQPVMFSLSVVNDEAMRDLNREYRQQDKSTDVLSFPLLDMPLVQATPELLWQSAETLDKSTSPALAEDTEAARQDTDNTFPTFVTPPELMTNLGDIVIAWPTVVRQAAEAGHSATYEFLYLLIHGVLHLVGYDDQTEAGYQEMVRLQRSLLTTFENH